MGSDYQMALLLQKQFEHDHLIDSDRRVALLVQQEFDNEIKIDDSARHLVYDTGNKKNSSKGNPSKSLTDPSWEVIDPTPNVHVLFVAFNERFFWNKLLAVSVSWSKRMTSCAGICSYNGRGGLCQITLSEPLLKLRPRKDLVETLLHEMIHAYLFVTHNNKDRDGHGPEFHKHMYRINAEAGTKITVYHDFIDEVRLYQQHWWRCNGPCQHRKPFFGMVRRAVNRAPGPNDRWWAEHSATCGGTFIKVKEPEKKAQKKNVSSKPKEDIRTYIPTNKSSAESNNSTKKDGVVDKTVVSGILSKAKPNQIQNINNTLKNQGKPKVVQVNSQNNLKNQNKSVLVSNKYPNTMTEIRGGKTNNSRSILVDLTQNSATGVVDLTQSSSDAFNTAKNHWKDKYSTSSQIEHNPGIKRSCDSASADHKVSKIKIDTYITTNSNSKNVDCPICGSEYTPELLDLHIDTCVPKNNDVKECIICLTKIESKFYEQHVIKCVDETFKDNFDEEDAVTLVNNTNLNASKSDDNKQDSPNDIKLIKKDSDNISKKHTNSVVHRMVDELDTKMCPVCDKSVATVNYDKHLETCLHGMYNDMENNYFENSNATTTKCLACGKNIVKSELNSHLEECMIDIFKDDGDLVPDSDNRDEYNCPFCLKLYSEKEMGRHIKECVECVDNTIESSAEKSVLLNSLFDTDDFS